MTPAEAERAGRAMYEARPNRIPCDPAWGALAAVERRWWTARAMSAAERGAVLLPFRPRRKESSSWV